MDYHRRSPTPYPPNPQTGAVSAYADRDDYPGQGPYGLAGDPYPPPSGPPHDPPQRAMPAKKVRTTLGRARPERYRQVPLDPNARFAAALRPGSLPAGGVWVADPLDDPPPAPTGRRAPLLHLRPLVARESPWYRALFAIVALFISAGFLVTLLQFFAPADPGAEAHAHLLAGRLIAEQGAPRLVPDDPFAFVGEYWVATGNVAAGRDGAAQQVLYPRLAPGLGVIHAGVHRVAPSEQHALQWSHLVVPVAAALVVLATFYLCRFAAGSFLGMLAMLAMAAGGLLLWESSQPSAIVSLALATWGMVLLVGWWRCGYLVLGLLAGLLLGCAATVRYAEALLVMPLALVCLFAWQWRRPLASGWRVLIPLIGWAAPVAALLVFNQRTLGAWSGHHLAGDLAAFDPDNISANWPRLAEQVAAGGLHFVIPLGLVGLLALVARRPPIGLTLLAWVLLPILACLSFGPETAADSMASRGVNYLPWILGALPPVLFGGAYLLRRVLYAPSDSAPQLVEAQDPYTGQPVAMLVDPPTPLWRSLASPLAAGLVAAAAVGIGARALADDSTETGPEALHLRSANLAALGWFVRQNVPDGSVIFVEAPATAAPGQALHHLDVAGDYAVYDAGIFSPRFLRRLSAPEGDASVPLLRYEHLRPAYEGLREPELAEIVRRIANEALDADREVYLLMNDVEARRFAQSHFLRGYETRTVATFHEWGPPERPDGAQSLARPGEWSLVRVTREAPVTPALPGRAEV